MTHLKGNVYANIILPPHHSPLSVIGEKATEDNRSFQSVLFPSVLWGNHVEHLFY